MTCGLSFQKYVQLKQESLDIIEAFYKEDRDIVMIKDFRSRSGRLGWKIMMCRQLSRINQFIERASVGFFSFFRRRESRQKLNFHTWV